MEVIMENWQLEDMTEEEYKEYCKPFPNHIVDLNQYATEQLLAMLNSSHRNCSRYYITINEYFNTDEIKSVLDTREHIPNKQEAKARRQKMAKQKS
jgi:hypothetical protein